MKRINASRSKSDKGKRMQTLSESAQKDLNTLTSLADTLMSFGHLNIFQESRSTLQKNLMKLKPKSIEKSLPNKSRKLNESEWWRYQWTSDSEIHGPFSKDQLLYWFSQGYFQSPILLQPVKLHVSVENDNGLKRKPKGEVFISDNNEWICESPFISSSEVSIE